MNLIIKERTGKKKHVILRDPFITCETRCKMLQTGLSFDILALENFSIVMNLKNVILKQKTSTEIRQRCTKVTIKHYERWLIYRKVCSVAEILCWDISLRRNINKLYQRSVSQIHTILFGLTTAAALVRTQKGLKPLIKKRIINPNKMD